MLLSSEFIPCPQAGAFDYKRLDKHKQIIQRYAKCGHSMSAFMKAQLCTDEFYHIYNRGVLKQPIFFDNFDNQRFVDNLHDFNSIHRTPEHRFKGGHSMSASASNTQLVSILAWCLMPNHFHLLIRQRVEGGISNFMRKLGDGYTKYINNRYSRTGHLFQGRFQSKLVDSNEYLLQLTKYIHLNPLEKCGHSMPALQYRWSSLQDWMGIENFPQIIDQELISELTTGIDYPRFLFSDSLPLADIQCLQEVDS